MYLKKTIIAWIVGIIIIISSLFWAVFGTWDIGKLTKEAEYRFSAEQIKNSCINNEIDMGKSVWTAQIDDAYFVIKLPRRARIIAIKIKLEEISNSNISQIYYSANSEMKGDAYWEISLKKGENIVEIEETGEIKNIRFDLTNKIGESFLIDSIEIFTDGEHRIEYLIFAPFLVIAYLILVFIYINKEFIISWIIKDKKRKEKYDLWDQIFALSISDFKGRFSGSYLGIFWGIIQPLSTILLFWFVFQVGFRSNPIDGVPFILWLAAGMIPWNYFYDSWFNGTNTFSAYSYIVKKVVFKIEVLPLVKVISSSILNLIFNGILVVIYCLYGRFMGLHLFDMLYFSFSLFVLTLGLSYITATLNVFIKDVGQFMGIILQILMWVTPLMWSYQTIPENMAWFYELNPLHYILNGYRESLINGHWFYYHWGQMIWFWIVTLAIFILGKTMMKRMKDHFADVL